MTYDNTLGNEAQDWILSSDLEINTFKGPDIAEKDSKMIENNYEILNLFS